MPSILHGILFYHWYGLRRRKWIMRIPPGFRVNVEKWVDEKLHIVAPKTFYKKITQKITCTFYCAEFQKNQNKLDEAVYDTQEVSLSLVSLSFSCVFDPLSFHYYRYDERPTNVLAESAATLFRSVSILQNPNFESFLYQLLRSYFPGCCALDFL